MECCSLFVAKLSQDLPRLFLAATLSGTRLAVTKTVTI